jgi:hypothetical protein
MHHAEQIFFFKILTLLLLVAPIRAMSEAASWIGALYWKNACGGRYSQIGSRAVHQFDFTIGL